MLTSILCLLGGLILGAVVVLLVLSHYAAAALTRFGFEWFSRR